MLYISVICSMLCISTVCSISPRSIVCSASLLIYSRLYIPVVCSLPCISKVCSLSPWSLYHISSSVDPILIDPHDLLFTWIHWSVLSSKSPVLLTIETPGILEGVGSWTSCIEVELHCSDSIVRSTVPAILGVSSVSNHRNTWSIRVCR